MKMCEVFIQVQLRRAQVGMTIDNRYYITLHVSTDKTQHQSENAKALTIVLTSVFTTILYSYIPATTGNVSKHYHTMSCI